MRAVLILLAALLVGAGGGATAYRVGVGSWPGFPSEGAGHALAQHQGHDSSHDHSAHAGQDHAAHGVAVTTLPPAPAAATRKILYYRNPMGLPDTSPVPKKDWMGMDYIPVHEGEMQEDAGTVRISPERVQRSGVRTARVERRTLQRPVMVPGAVRIDERRIKVVTLRTDGFIEELFVNATGQTVRAGQPLFRVYSPLVQQAQIDLITALREGDGRAGTVEANRRIDGPAQRLRNLGIPEARIREVIEQRSNPRTIDWPSPMNGIVLEKKVVDGQRAAAGDELYRIADLGVVWIVADLPERELAYVRVGDQATLSFLAYPGETRQGRVAFVYPDVNPETRTVRMRIELANADGRLKLDMYADVTLQAGAGDAPMIVVPDSALIDSGTRRVVIVAKGEGRFEPRPVRTGRRGDGHVEITDGLAEGEEVVSAAAFLIDAESNLQSALRRLTAPDAPK